MQFDKNDKALQKQLEKVPSIKDLQIAEKIERLRQFNNNNNNNNNINNNNNNNNNNSNNNIIIIIIIIITILENNLIR